MNVLLKNDLMMLAVDFSVIFSLVSIIIGVLAILNPNKMSKGFGIALDSDKIGYVVSLGARDIFMGLVLLYFYVEKDLMGISLTTALLALVALTDYLVVKKQGTKKESIVHLASFIFISIYSFLILCIDVGVFR